jgi:hypothetical protein
MLIVGPNAAAAVIDNDNNDDNHRRGGGVSCPLFRFVPTRRTLLVIVNVADRGQRQRHNGVWSVVVRVVEEEGPSHCTHLSGSDPTGGG